MHQLCCFEVEAKGNSCCRQMAWDTIWQKPGARHPARFKKLSHIARALLHEHGFALGNKSVQHSLERKVLAAWRTSA